MTKREIQTGFRLSPPAYSPASRLRQRKPVTSTTIRRRSALSPHSHTQQKGKKPKGNFRSVAHEIFIRPDREKWKNKLASLRGVPHKAIPVIAVPTNDTPPAYPYIRRY
ncbi:hypothetical protein AND_000549 [Anopheles darlingi]|uniref:Uncharacterized protein n=1 Tax=Anopheles darlingi TaxID=43151 RepID=W5JWW7_ANODA|nr:hypothetical protein AND_000549 [Anopheles darlingi]